MKNVDVTLTSLGDANLEDLLRQVPDSKLRDAFASIPDETARGYAVLDYLRRELGASFVEQHLAAAKTTGLQNPVTHLPNCRAYDMAVQNRYAQGAPTTLVLVDLDRFRVFNNEYGYQTGDEALKAVARASRNLPGTFHHWGGDEFAVVVDKDLEEGVRYASGLRSALQQSPFVIRNTDPPQKVTISATYGITNQGRDPDELFANANRALRRAKVTQRGSIVVLDSPPDNYRTIE